MIKPASGYALEAEDQAEVRLHLTHMSRAAQFSWLSVRLIILQTQVSGVGRGGPGDCRRSPYQ